MNRGLEISADAADAASSLILDQVAAGVAVRMAVLYQLLGGATTTPATRDGHVRPHEPHAADQRRRPARAAAAATCCVRDGVFVDSAERRPAATPSVVDADGLVALPGLVDLHTHLREPGREDAETVATGTAAAAASAASPRCWRWPTPTRSPTPPRRPSGSADLGPRGRAGRRRAGRRGQQGPGRRASWPSSG